MATYEITLTFPDQPLDRANRAFLGSVVAAIPTVLDGFRSCGGGVALTFVIEDARNEEVATRAAYQRAAGIWPNFSAELAEVRALTRDDADTE
jgi:hypothetical protein